MQIPKPEMNPLEKMQKCAELMAKARELVDALQTMREELAECGVELTISLNMITPEN
jgi:hypothetical protein